MEAKYKTSNGMFEFTFNVKGQQELFAEVGKYREIFDIPKVFQIAGHDVSCGEVNFVVRKVDKFTYYELRYDGPNKELWGYRKSFGVPQDSAQDLFPRHKVPEGDEDKYESGGNGWFKWKTVKGARVEKKDVASSEQPF